MEEITPIESEERQLMFRLFRTRRRLKKHIALLRDTRTKHPKSFELIFNENVEWLDLTEKRLRDSIKNRNLH